MNPSPAVHPARVMAGGICAVILTIGIARFAYTPLLPVMREQAQLTSIGAGWLATSNYVGYLFGAIIASSIHTLERKFILYRVGLACAVISTLAMGFTHDFWLWMGLRFLSGWSSTAGMLLATGLVLNWLVRHRHKAELGVHFAGFGLGMVISGLAAAWMAGRLRWDQEWMVLAALGFVFLLPAWRWVPAPQPLAVADARQEATIPPDSWLRLFFLAYFCGGFGYVITATFIVDIVRNLHSAIQGDWIWLIMGAAAVPSCILWDRLSARIGQMRGLTLAYASQTLSFALTAWGASPIALVLAAILFGATVIGTVGLTLSIIGRMFPANPARAMAKLTIGYGIAQILGPLVAGYLSHRYGNYQIALIFATGVGLLGTGLSWILGTQHTRSRQQTSS